MTFTDTETVPNILKTPGGPPVRSVSGDIGDGLGGPKSLLRRLVDFGVVLSADNGRLAIDARADVLSDALVRAIRSHREELLALVDVPSDLAEPLGLGPGWVCPWCRTGDRLAPSEPDGLRCVRCDRLAFRWIGAGGVERCDWVEPVLFDAPGTAESVKPVIAPRFDR